MWHLTQLVMQQGTNSSLHLHCLAANFKTGSSLPMQVLTCLEVCCRAAASGVLCFACLMPNDAHSSKLVCAVSITHNWVYNKAQAAHFICRAAANGVLCFACLMPNDAYRYVHGASHMTGHTTRHKQLTSSVLSCSKLQDR